MTWWQDFHFLRPYWLLALVIPVLLFGMIMGKTYVQSAWSKVCDKNLLDFLLVKGSGQKGNYLKYSMPLSALFLVIALAGPTWMKKDNPALSMDNPVMILLNMSGEMWNKDVSPNRISRAKYVVKDLTSTLKNTESGLIVYSREPFVITPLTEDGAIIDNLLPALEMNIMPQDGDRLDRAVDLAVVRMKNVGFSNGNIIVLTSNIGERFDKVLESAAKASHEGFDVNIINMNSAENDKLKMVANKGNGVYLKYNQSLSSLIDKINDITMKEIKQSQNMQTVWTDNGWYFLWFPLILLLGYFRRGLIFLFILGMFEAYFNTASANWFLNNNQQGLKNFEKQNYDVAADKFTDQRWKGAALYKKGDYAAAYESFSKKDDAVALYNQGNALAKMGKIDEAIKKYEEALQKKQKFPDAKFNLEYLKKQKQQQQKQQSQQSQQKDKKQNEQQNEKNTQQNAEQNEQQDKKDDLQKKQSENQDSSMTDSKKNPSQAESSKEQSEDVSKDNEDSEQQSSEIDKSQQKENESSSKKENNASKEQSQKQQTDASDKNGEQNDNKNISDVKEDEAQKTDEKKELSISAGDGNQKNKREKIKAKMQKFRQVPEDKGGLLRAFIQKEYARKRYEE